MSSNNIGNQKTGSSNIFSDPEATSISQTPVHRTSSFKHDRSPSPSESSTTKKVQSNYPSYKRKGINFDGKSTIPLSKDEPNDVEYLSVMSKAATLDLTEYKLPNLKKFTLHNPTATSTIRLPQNGHDIEAHYVMDANKPVKKRLNKIIIETVDEQSNVVNSGALKGRPYYQNTDVLSHNNKVPYKGGGGKISCIPLAFNDIILRQQHDQEKKVNLSQGKKVDLPKFYDRRQEQVGTEELIQENISLGFTETANKVISSSKENYEVEHSEAGKFFSALFKEMEKNQPNEVQYKYMMWCSGNHAMSGRLALKPTIDGKYNYVVTFYDPNDTPNHSRIIVDNASVSDIDDLNEIKNWKISHFFRNANEYYGTDESGGLKEDVSLCTVLENDVYQKINNPNHDFVKAERGLVSYTSKEAMSPIQLYNRFEHGFPLNPDQLGKLKEQLKACTPEDKSELIAAKNSQGKSGLRGAMKESHINMIKQFGEILLEQKDLKGEQMVELLMNPISYANPVTRKTDTQTPLLAALWANKPESITEFGEIVLDAVNKGLLTKNEAKKVLFMAESDAKKTFSEQRSDIEPEAINALKAIQKQLNNIMDVDHNTMDIDHNAMDIDQK